MLKRSDFNHMKYVGLLIGCPMVIGVSFVEVALATCSPTPEVCYLAKLGANELGGGCSVHGHPGQPCIQMCAPGALCRYETSVLYIGPTMLCTEEYPNWEELDPPCTEAYWACCEAADGELFVVETECRQDLAKPCNYPHYGCMTGCYPSGSAYQCKDSTSTPPIYYYDDFLVPVGECVAEE